MKSLLRLLMAPLVWFLQACSPLGKPVDLALSDNFYYNKSETDIIYSSMGNWFELGKSPLNADPESFIVLNDHLGKDKNQAYYREHAITDPALDLESFRASNEDWMWHIGMDDHRVYAFSHDVINGEWQLITKIVETADPATFQQYDLYWSKDAQRHFYNHEAISVDYATFEIINDTFAKDKGQIYLHYQGRFEAIAGDAEHFVKMDRYHARDSSHVFFFLTYLRGEQQETLKQVLFQDASTLRIVEESYLFADDAVYYRGTPLLQANAEQMVILSETYAKDDQRVYYQDIEVEGADAATFDFDDKQFVYRDKRHRYRDGKVWHKDEGTENASSEMMDLSDE
ncbi:MAG: DKNYY domain-containing protein [Bacteroidota bacterium]